MKKSCGKFLNEFLAPLKSESQKFSKQSLAYTLGSITETMKAPALFSLAFGLLILISPGKIDKILYDGINENFQNTGGVIILYSTAILYGFILLSCKSCMWLCNLLRYILNATSYLGHLIVSVTAGIGLGLIFPTFLELEVKTEIFNFISIVFELILIATCYQLVNRFASQTFILDIINNIKSRSINEDSPFKNVSSFIYEQRHIIRLIFGWCIIFSAGFSMYNHNF